MQRSKINCYIGLFSSVIFSGIVHFCISVMGYKIVGKKLTVTF